MDESDYFQAQEDAATGKALDAAAQAALELLQAALELLSDSDESAFDADRVECMLKEALELLDSSKAVDKSV